MRRFILIFPLLFSCFHAQAMMTAKPNLTILTDESLLLPFAQLTRDYAKLSKTPITMVLVKNADDAEAQIEQGLEAHVLITANGVLISKLSEQGLTDVSSRRGIARTQLALVTTSDLGGQATIAKRISFGSMLGATPNLPVLANDPSTIEGARANALMTGYEFSPALAARLSLKPNHDEVIASLQDAPSLALVLAADTTTEPDIRVLSLLPTDLSPPVTYEAVVLAGESMEDAKAFTQYLSTKAARAILAHFGYQPPN